MPSDKQDHSGAREAVRDIYDGSEGDLFALVFGEQIHLGGFDASVALADASAIRGGRGVDLCCCNGAGMRFLVRYRGVESMIGVDISPNVVARGRRRCQEEGQASQIDFLCTDACASGLPSESADFVWSEDAWCYVPDKPILIAEAARIVRRGGTIAFTDWVEGDAGLESGENAFLLEALSFPNLETQRGYQQLLEKQGCEVVLAEDTGNFAKQTALVAEVLETQLRWDALRLLSYDEERVDALIRGFRLLSEWGAARKIAQARFVTRRVS